jgi:predicted DNA-binding transcriptional regulator AlpA
MLDDHLKKARVLDRKQTLELLGLGDRTWDRMSARGELPPATKLSARRTGYRLSDIEAWLDARRKQPAAA